MARRPNRAEQAAIDLLDEADITEAPIPVEQIAATLDVDVRPEPLEGGLSGMLYRAQDGHVVLGVNSAHARVRQRFTIAHELGHFLLHRDTLHVDGLVRRDETSSLAIDTKEIEANAFAAELLMPRDLVLERVEELLPKSGVADPARLVSNLARTFGFSEQAMDYRLANLGLSTSF
jgi:Zn-dependent peptidase ImmA (M78 family)